MILLAIYLLLVGISPFISLGQLSQLVPLVALIAGLVILLGR
jgi:hypothetical protein